jgi:hypothetical protein
MVEDEADKQEANVSVDDESSEIDRNKKAIEEFKNFLREQGEPIDEEMLDQVIQILIDEGGNLAGAVDMFKELMADIGIPVSGLAEPAAFMGTFTLYMLIPAEDEEAQEIFKGCDEMVENIKSANEKVNDCIDTDLAFAERFEMVTAAESPFGVPAIVIRSKEVSAEEKINIIKSIENWESVATYLQLSYGQGFMPTAFVFDPHGNMEMEVLVREKAAPEMLARIPGLFPFEMGGLICLGIGFTVREVDEEQPADKENTAED